MSLAIACKPQGNGSNTGWSLIVGETLAFKAVDDSADTAHDSEETYFRLPRLLGAGGIISFPFFRGWAGGRPLSVAVNVGARQVAAAHPGIRIGFVRGAAFGFDGTLFVPDASWQVSSRTFTTNPITGAAWTAAEMAQTEVCLASEDLVVGNNDVTLVSASVEYLEPHNYDPIVPTSGPER